MFFVLFSTDSVPMKKNGENQDGSQATISRIAEVIGKSKGTVSREIRRNSDMRGYHRYRWDLAQRKYERRMHMRNHYIKFTDDMKSIVRTYPRVQTLAI